MNLSNVLPIVILGSLVGAVSIGCGGGATPRPAEPKAPPPPLAPKISQVATRNQIVGVDGAAADSRLGYSIAVGDFNGDGFADAASGMPGANGGVGAVALVYGTSSGLDLSNPNLFTRVALNEAVLVGFGSEQGGDQFGYAVATGDFDGDGLADLAIGAPYRSAGGQADSGEVFVAYGSRAMGNSLLVDRADRFTQTGAGAGNEAGDHFGLAFACGDFNGDGYGDLAIGAPDEDDAGSAVPDSGAVYVRYGSSRGLTSTGFHVITAARSTHGRNAVEAGARFGRALAAGNLDRELTTPRQHDELVVGAPNADVVIDSVTSGETTFTDCGKAYIYSWHSSTNQLEHDLDVTPNTWPLGVRTFAYALAIGDFDGDARNDLAIGAPNAGADTRTSGGRVYVAKYNPVNGTVGTRAFPDEANTQWHRRTDQTLSQAPLGVVENGDQFGNALAAADFDLDGFTDLAASAQREDWEGAVNDGLVFVLMGSSQGLRTNSTSCGFYFLDQRPSGVNEANDLFGFALATGDVNGDLRPDLVIGAPYEDDNGAGAEDAGALFLARTRTSTTGPFDGRWRGTVNGDNGTSATLTLRLCDRDRIVLGLASLNASIEIDACSQTVTLGRRAGVSASKSSSTSTTATGTLVAFPLPDDVSASVSLSMAIAADGVTLTGMVRVRDVVWNGIDVGSCGDVDLPVTLTRLP